VVVDKVSECLGNKDGAYCLLGSDAIQFRGYLSTFERNRQLQEQGQNIVVYLLKARTVEAEKQPLLGNGPYTRSIGTRHVLCHVMQQ
jgi:hypothetical protein